MIAYEGFVDTVYDALLLFEAFSLKKIPGVTRRLTRDERERIGSGMIFIWDEDEAGILRWTDGRRWSSSRPCGNFIYTWHAMQDSNVPPSRFHNTARNHYPVLRGGLIKRALSINTADGRRMHLVSYYTAAQIEEKRLSIPRQDPKLQTIQIRRHLYPE
ncbi:Gti1/Pac2 family-domain-containing protein, partial [Syncephalis pseudoplumigaleata]